MPHEKLYLDKLDERSMDREEKYKGSVSLRRYQQKAVEEIEAELAFGSGNDICLWGVTSFGKTITIAQFIKNQLEQDKSIVFMMNLTALIEQTINTLKSMNIEYKVIAAEYDGMEFNHKAKVTIAMQQTLYERLYPREYTDKKTGQKKKRKPIIPPNCDILIIDEYHRSFRTDTMEAVKDKLKPDNIIGISGTPYDEKSHAFPDVDIIETATIDDLTSQGYLTPLKTYIAEFSEAIDYTDAGSGEYSDNYLAGKIDTPEYNKSVVKAWWKIASKLKTIVFATTIEHAEHLAKEFNTTGATASAYHSKQSKKDSKATMDAFKTGYLQVLVSVSKILVGFDYPGIECIVACRPTRTRRVWQQACGRSIRLYPGKKEAILLDMAQWTAEHGFYNDHFYPLPLDQKEELKKQKQELQIKVTSAIAKEEPTEITRHIVVEKVKELERKKKQIPQLSISDILAIFNTSQDPRDIIWISYEINKRKTGQQYKLTTIDWIAKPWYKILEDFPEYNARLLKSLRTRSKNIVHDGKKLASLYYFEQWMREQTPYSYLNQTENQDVVGPSNQISDHELNLDQIQF